MSERKVKQQATETGLQIHHVNDDCLGEILTRAAALQSSVPWCSSACGPLLRVCRRFRDVLLGRALGAIISKPGDEALLRFACSLQSLSVEFPAVGRLSLSPPIVECLSGVTQLALSDVRHSDSIRDFAALPALAELWLTDVVARASKGEALLNHVAQLSLLTCLKVEYATLDAVPERSFAGLTCLRHLRTLALTSCYMASSACLRFVTALTGLSDLTLRSLLPALDADGCIALASALPELVALDVAYDFATDEGLAHLSSLTLLSILDLSEARYSTRRAQHQAVTRLRSLRCLLLSADYLSEDEDDEEDDAPPVLQLGGLQRLERLKLYEDRSQQVSALQGLTALTYLNINSHWRERGGREDAVAALASLTSLLECRLDGPSRSLALGGLSCSSGFLTVLTALTHLVINTDTITDAQLAAVSTLTRLRELDVTSEDKSDVWSSRSIASIALLTRLVSLRLEPGGYVCGSATSQLLSLRSLEVLHIRAVGHAGRDFVRELTDGLRRLRRLEGSVGGLPSAACAQLTQLTHLSGYLMVPTEGLKYVFEDGRVSVYSLR